ncbi:imidazole glycerol phosphate synthase subunit HisH [Flammeovirga agarivorans]|uniref:Imidazole glycerol phosphate synthase subunit HisH n=1 Tax=Flammeovirga agarivorans TaxID=2726742 RepID=A0A7X8XUJ2_9BACT|nr:imidazole glycerol phosphate synthase subunit HisH [Flammeovirga agarivorans]NLR90406.1 imidazole glycerol phosphate synthase subunit HisH [Flammeovirga agarivorans]
MKVAIIKYNAGNVQSVRYALQRIGIDPILTDNPEEITSADKVIFPGVGEAKSAMDYLKERKLDQLIKDLKQPTLGVCLGLQLMCNHSEERDTDCLGIFDTNVKKFQSEILKVPHMGWNNIHDLKTDLYKGIHENDYVYYVHSYFAELCENTIAVTDYVNPYSASLHKDNFFAAQFHPEKSGDVGQKIIQNFITNF